MERQDQGLRSDPDREVIENILFGPKKLDILKSAVQLKIFDEVAAFNNAASVTDIASHRNFKDDVTERMLNGLVCLQLLEKQTLNEGQVVYANTPGAEKYLKGDARLTFVKELESLEYSPSFCSLLPYAIEAGSFETCTLLKHLMNGTNTMESEKRVQQPEQVKVFMVRMDALLVPCLDALVKAFDLTGHKRIVDLGGGSGRLAREFARTYPDMHVSVFDLPVVVQVSKSLQAERKSPVHYVEGDFFKDVLPPADVYILSHIIHDWGIEDIDILLERVFQHLPPGGCLLICEKLLNEDRTGPFGCIWLDLKILGMTLGSRERCSSEYQSLLEKHGFVDVQSRTIAGSNYYDAIMGKKPNYQHAT